MGVENREVSRAGLCLDSQAQGSHEILGQGSGEVRFLLSKYPSGCRKEVD